MSGSPDPEARPDFLVMAKPAGPTCNLSCRYCYYLGKERLFPPGRPRRMERPLLERYIAERIACATGPAVHFEWHGGEPTALGLDFFREVVAIEGRHRRTGLTLSNGLQTNGLLIDAEWARFLAGEGFSVGLSLDGPREMHDAYRVTREGRGSHRQVERAYGLLARSGAHVDVLCVLHAANVGEPGTLYRYFRDLGVRYLQFLPLVERAGAGVSERTPASGAVGEFLCAVFDEWVRQDIGRVVVQWFDEAFRPACGLPHALCVFRETCGDVLALEHEGSLYACDHFVDPEHRLGSLADAPLAELAAKEELGTFGRAKRDALPATCRACDVLAFCNGGCPKDRLCATPAGEPGLNYLCTGFQRFFRHARPVLEKLAALRRAGRPVAEWSKAFRQEEAPARPDVGRNDPCPCGSGKKYKKCCLNGVPQWGLSA